MNQLFPNCKFQYRSSSSSYKKPERLTRYPNLTCLYWLKSSAQRSGGPQAGEKEKYSTCLQFCRISRACSTNICPQSRESTTLIPGRDLTILTKDFPSTWKQFGIRKTSKVSFLRRDVTILSTAIFWQPVISRRFKKGIYLMKNREKIEVLFPRSRDIKFVQFIRDFSMKNSSVYNVSDFCEYLKTKCRKSLACLINKELNEQRVNSALELTVRQRLKSCKTL